MVLNKFYGKIIYAVLIFRVIFLGTVTTTTKFAMNKVFEERILKKKKIFFYFQLTGNCYTRLDKFLCKRFTCVMTCEC